MTITIPSSRVIPLGEDPNGFASLAVARGGGGSPASGFSAESGFSLLDNGDGTLSVADSQARFGTKPNAAKPVWFFDFSSGSDQPHPTLSRQQKTINWSAPCQITQEVAKPGSTHSMTIDSPSFGSVFADGDATLSLPLNSGRKFYRYYDVYNDFTYTQLADGVAANPATGASSENFKTHRWQVAGLNQSTDPYTPNVLQANNYRFSFSGDEATTYESILYQANSYLTAPMWNVEEEYHQVSSSAGATDAVMYGVLNGEQKFVRDNQDSHKGADPTLAENQWEHYKLGNFNSWAEPGVAPWRANILYVDDSWCRVYITDKPTWSDSEEKAIEIQVPVGWAAGQVDFHQRIGALGSLAGKYLWIADNDDTKILVGGWL